VSDSKASIDRMWKEGDIT